MSSQLPPSSFLGSRAARLDLARQQFFEEGLTPTGVVSDAVFQSWSRCLRLRHRPGDRAVFEPVTASRSHLALQKNRHLLQAWLEVSPKLESMLGTTSCAAMLTDPTGVLIGASCAGRAHEELMPVATRVGVNLSEEAVGTTAPGVVARTGKAVSVLGADHFFESVKGMHCSAAPIRGITGALAGVLDLSSETLPFAFDAAAVTGLFAAEIENRLLIAQSNDHLVVRFQIADELLDSALVGLVGIDTRGRLAWHNGVARSLLGMSSPQETQDFGLDEMFGLRMAQLASLPETGSSVLTLPNGLMVRARAEMRSPDGPRHFVAVPRTPEVAFTDLGVNEPDASVGQAAEIPSAKTTLRAFDRDLIDRTLQACGGNVSQAARSLQVSRNFIYRRLRSVDSDDLATRG